jgi:molybdate transport system substrate-binding protein
MVACGATASGGPASSGSSGEASGQVTVFAASSLSAAFDDLGGAFHTRYPNASAQFSFAGSQVLAAQITQVAPADVFASADKTNMDKVVAAGYSDGQPKGFASNKLAIVVPAGNPRAISSLADLARPGLVVVLCTPAAPCGAYAQQALTRAGVQVNPRSQEQDVKGVVTKVSLKEADAGIAYVSDVMAGGPSVTGVDIPDTQNVVAHYPIVRVKSGLNRAAPQAFIDFVLSPEGQAILARHGFGAP